MRVLALPAVGRRSGCRSGPSRSRAKVRCGSGRGLRGLRSDHFLQEGGFGPSVRMPVVPGHEAAGRVDALGPGVTGWATGDQVAIHTITTPAGDPWAAAGRPNISPRVTRMGVDVDGAFAEYVIRPVEALVRPAGQVPPEVLAVLTDAVATPAPRPQRIAHPAG